jgi:drug/metabolite transporter (DMT)-like permease
MPVSSTLLGALFLGEQVTPVMVVGMLVIFSGLTLLNWRDVRKMVGDARRRAVLGD